MSSPLDGHQLVFQFDNKEYILYYYIFKTIEDRIKIYFNGIEAIKQFQFGNMMASNLKLRLMVNREYLLDEDEFFKKYNQRIRNNNQQILLLHEFGLYELIKKSSIRFALELLQQLKLIIYKLKISKIEVY